MLQLWLDSNREVPIKLRQYSRKVRGFETDPAFGSAD